MLVQDGLLNSSVPHPISMAADLPALAGSIERLGARMSYFRDSEIYGEGECADYLYKVLSGAVRTYNVLIDGRRQVRDFHFPGDFFGLETDERHLLSAETITDSTILVIKRSSVMGLARYDQEITERLWAMTNAELRRAHSHVVLLIKTARERVAAFLLEMADRMPATGQVNLPMSRQDIADYLGLTIETVSRTLTDLEKKSAISLLSSRRLVLRNLPKLTQLAARDGTN
jgi:CRP/FNR family nitrogen fixation transcriptional regulator